MRSLLVAACLLTGIECVAAPVYLECQVMQSGKENLWKVTVDEAAGTVSYSHSLASGKYPGIFTADKVSFGGNEINRVDLSIAIPIPLISRIDRGQCEIVKQPARQF